MNFTPTVILQLYRLLPKKYRYKLTKASASTFAMAIMDLLSLGILLPVLLLVLDKDSISQNHFFALLYQKGGFESEQTFIVTVCLVVFLISLGRTLFNTYMQYTQNKRLFEISNYLSLRLYKLYYSKGFLYIKQHNSLRLINQINGVAQYLIQGYFIPLTSLICEVLVVLTILTGLILFNPYVFLLAFLTFVPISWIYYRYSRTRMRKYGDFLYHIIPEKNKLLQQTFVGYTDVEMSNSFEASNKKYAQLLNQQNNYSVKKMVLSTTLQRVLELAVVCSVIVLILATQLLQLPSLGIIIGIFVIAIYRILPGIIKGSGYYFTMRENTFALDLLNEVEQTEGRRNSLPSKDITFEDSISYNSISFSYDKINPVLTNLSLKIKKGDFIGIKGESGSGKSTLFHLLLGFLQPDEGNITVDNVLLSEEYMKSWHDKIGYVSQQLFMIEGSLLDNIVMSVGDSSSDPKRIHEVLKLASLDKFVNSLPQGVDTFIGEGGCMLSGGQRQRLGIARALYKNVEILLFDEATSSLDENTEKAINQAILYLAEQCKDLTLLVISHRAESLSICRRIIDITEIQN
ncbi:ABC transporter ATP-binding protein [Bacteroides sp.]|uniref:ABC transporter ATP-binding protein n=1 Tax=Bacteroides sp. TaxID=29523 RepID=UPI0026118514|nr:ABC transporter ATP-binding protein [Bacteroides sp.]